MESALDEIQVFANSANVVRMFEALTDGATTNRALSERTGAARSTVGRILDKGESRDWIDSEGSRYELTHLGRVMTEEFRGYLRTVEGIQHLGEDFQYLPEQAHELDYRHFRDATIIKPTAAYPSAPFDHMEELIRTGDKFPRVISRTVTPRHERVTWELWGEGKQVSGGVLGASFLETLRDDPERAEPWYEWAESDVIWIHEDPQITVMFSDGIVLIGMGEEREDEVYATGVLESENPAVLSWAESLFGEYRAESEPLTPEMLPER
jgi:predicted transcriptional regulator